MELIHNCKIKIVCKLENQQYQENLYLDNQLQEEDSNPDFPDAQDSDVQISYQALQSAKQFFHAFSPEILLRDLCERYGEHSVVVFRTTEQQMKNFCEINFQEIFTENA